MDEIQKIFYAIEEKDIIIFRAYLPKVNINAQDCNGLSMLHKAIAFECTEIANSILDHSININIQDDNGQTPLHYLAFFPNYSIARRIISLNGELEIRDAYGNTPLWYAVYNAKGEYNYVELLLQNHANPNAFNSVGKTPLSFARQIGDDTLLAILMKSI